MTTSIDLAAGDDRTVVAVLREHDENEAAVSVLVRHSVLRTLADDIEAGRHL